jgi:hypothetical protein
MYIKALTLSQPWASFVAWGAKTVETRSWATRYRGWLAVHASKRFPVGDRNACYYNPNFRRLMVEHHLAASELPRGSVLCIVRFKDCIPTEQVCKVLAESELGLGNYDRGRHAWVLEELLHVFNPPIPAKGALGLWDWELPVDMILPATE